MRASWQDHHAGAPLALGTDIGGLVRLPPPIAACSRSSRASGAFRFIRRISAVPHDACGGPTRRC
jgi:hypothetical protein